MDMIHIDLKKRFILSFINLYSRFPKDSYISIFRFILPFLGFTLFKSVQAKNADISKQFPLIMTSGRLVEFEGGGDETRSNRFLAELQPEMFVEINPVAANDRGIRNGEDVWVTTPTGARIKVKAQVTERVDRETVFMPYHFAGHWQGVDMNQFYPNGAAPIIRGEAVNTATTYGYDIVTMMQETKTTVCQIEKAA